MPAPLINVSSIQWTNNESNSNNIFDHIIFIKNNNDNSFLNEKLRKWVFDFHISHNCVNALLSILKSEGLQLPKDIRTLLKTPEISDHNIVSIHPGSYIHLGVEFYLKSLFYILAILIVMLQ